jgi:hypothetical protein
MTQNTEQKEAIPKNPYEKISAEKLRELSILLTFFIMADEQQGRERAHLLYTLRKYLADNANAEDNAKKNIILQAALEQDFEKVFKLFSGLEISFNKETTFATELEKVVTERESGISSSLASLSHGKNKAMLTSGEKALLAVCVLAALGFIATAWSLPELNEAEIDLGADAGATAAHVLTFCGFLLLAVTAFVAYRRWQGQKTEQLPDAAPSSSSPNITMAKSHVNILETQACESFERQESELTIELDELKSNADNYLEQAIALLQKGFEIRPDLLRKIAQIEASVTKDGASINFDITWQGEESKEVLGVRLEHLYHEVLNRVANQPDSEPKDNETWRAIKSLLRLNEYWGPVEAAQTRREQIQKEKQDALITAMTPLLELEIDAEKPKFALFTAENIEKLYLLLEGVKLPMGIKWHITEQGKVEVDAPEVSSGYTALDHKIKALAREVLNKAVNPDVLGSYRNIDAAFLAKFCLQFNVAELDGATLKQIQDEQKAIDKIHSALVTARYMHNKITKTEAGNILLTLHAHSPKNFSIGYDEKRGCMCIRDYEFKKPIYHPALKPAVENFIAAVLNRFWLNGAEAASHGIDWDYLDSVWFTETAVIEIDKVTIPVECQALAKLESFNSLSYGDVSDEKLKVVLDLLESLVTKLEIERGSNAFKSVDFKEDAVSFKENKTRLRAGIKALVNTVLNKERQEKTQQPNKGSDNSKLRTMYTSLSKGARGVVDDLTKTKLSQSAVDSFKTKLNVTEVAPEAKKGLFA